MARQVDLNSPLSQEDVDYLISRGRRYQLHANFRRFGPPGDYHEPAEGEEAGQPPRSVFYDEDERNQAVYDTGGAPLPGTTLDYDTGRVLDRDNGAVVEPAHAGHTPGAFGSRYDFVAGRDEDNSDIDEDIAGYVTSLSITDLEKELKEKDLGVPGHKDVSDLSVDELVNELHEREVQTEKTDKKPDLVKKLKAKLSQERKEDMQDALAIHLQDSRRAGSEVSV
jgi:hypothetical protein